MVKSLLPSPKQEGWELGCEDLGSLGSRSVLSFSPLSASSPSSSPSLPASLSFYRSLNTVQASIELVSFLFPEYWDTGCVPGPASHHLKKQTVSGAEWLGADIDRWGRM